MFPTADSISKKFIAVLYVCHVVAHQNFLDAYVAGGDDLLFPFLRL